VAVHRESERERGKKHEAMNNEREMKYNNFQFYSVPCISRYFTCLFYTLFSLSRLFLLPLLPLLLSITSPLSAELFLLLLCATAVYMLPLGCRIKNTEKKLFFCCPLA
jgi:hypothetical protein